jgi:hypothetical protein
MRRLTVDDDRGVLGRIAVRVEVPHEVGAQVRQQEQAEHYKVRVMRDQHVDSGSENARLGVSWHAP